MVDIKPLAVVKDRGLELRPRAARPRKPCESTVRSFYIAEGVGKAFAAFLIHGHDDVQFNIGSNANFQNQFADLSFEMSFKWPVL